MISLSVIIPIYNVEQYIQRCIQSIIKQNYIDVCVECIIVDDCSPDCSMDIVHQLISDYEGPIRFEILRHEVNRGLSAARNTGIRKASGDYVLFLDSDDYLIPDSIGYFIKNILSFPHVDMVIGNVKNCKSGELLIHNIERPSLIDDPDVFFADMLHQHIYLYAWNKLIRRKVLTDNDIFFIEGIIYEDLCWSYQLFSNIHSILILPRITYVYEYSVNSIVNASLTKEKTNMIVWSYLVTCEKLLDSPPDPKKYRHDVFVDYLLFICDPMMRALDIMIRWKDSNNKKRFMKVRYRLVSKTLKSGRILLLPFFTFLFKPFSYLMYSRFFRVHYSYMEKTVARICHFTDFIHRK